MSTGLGLRLADMTSCPATKSDAIPGTAQMRTSPAIFVLGLGAVVNCEHLAQPCTCECYMRVYYLVGGWPGLNMCCLDYHVGAAEELVYTYMERLRSFMLQDH
jgi:hypothetical protein